MPIITLIFLLAASASTAFAQTARDVASPLVGDGTSKRSASAPSRAAQRGDASRLVDIYYDLSHNAACNVWVVLSGDGRLSRSVQGDLP